MHALCTHQFMSELWLSQFVLMKKVQDATVQGKSVCACAAPNNYYLLFDFLLSARTISQ